jgi:hypothetical protein
LVSLRTEGACKAVRRICDGEHRQRRQIAGYCAPALQLLEVFLLALYGLSEAVFALLQPSQLLVCFNMLIACLLRGRLMLLQLLLVLALSVAPRLTVRFTLCLRGSHKSGKFNVTQSNLGPVLKL